MKWMLLILIGLACCCATGFQAEGQLTVAFTFDDPATEDGPLFNWQERNQRILEALDGNSLQATLFTCGKRIDSPEGRQLLAAWDSDGHQIANHSYSHFYFPSEQVTFRRFEEDLLRNDSLIRSYEHYTKLYRFPYLKEGHTALKRDSARLVLEQHGYRNGHVTIDASDWYYNQVLTEMLRNNPKADLEPLHRLYLAHLIDRAHYYDSLGMELTGRRLPHILLLHHNLINALFLADVIESFHRQGWCTVSTEEAWSDPIYRLRVSGLPAGESLVWQLAHVKAGSKGCLRYPAEGSEYEEPIVRRILRVSAAN